VGKRAAKGEDSSRGSNRGSSRGSSLLLLRGAKLLIILNSIHRDKD